MSIHNPSKEEIKQYWDHHFYKQWDNFPGLCSDTQKLLSYCKFSLEEIVNTSLFRLLKYSKEKFDWSFWDEERGDYTRIMDANYKIIGYLLARPTTKEDKYSFCNRYDDSYDILLENIISEFLYKKEMWHDDALLDFARTIGEDVNEWDEFDFIEFIASYCINSELTYYVGHLPFERLKCSVE